MGTVLPIFARFKYRSWKKMNQEDEKYRIKPRKKYGRQVWLMNGKAIIVDPIEKKNAETENDRKEEWEMVQKWITKKDRNENKHIRIETER